MAAASPAIAAAAVHAGAALAVEPAGVPLAEADVGSCPAPLAVPVAVLPYYHSESMIFPELGWIWRKGLGDPLGQDPRNKA